MATAKNMLLTLLVITLMLSAIAVNYSKKHSRIVFM